MVGRGDRAVKVGVLALQGDFREHRLMLRDCGVQAERIRRPRELAELAGLVIPGGESTTIGRLMDGWGLTHAIRERAQQGMGIFGTCAGLILMAGEVEGGTSLEGRPQPVLSLMDMTVRRNAFGRQRESFEADLAVPQLGDNPLRAVFIRAPQIERVGSNVEVLAELDGHTVLARQGRLLAAAFHPELTDDLRLHRYFLEEVLNR